MLSLALLIAALAICISQIAEAKAEEAEQADRREERASAR